MARGGARPNSGPKKGTKYAPTLRKERLRALLEARVEKRFGPIVDALLDAAEGVYHMMAKDRDGKWIQVTDPVIMARVLNSGETFYKIHAQNPDVRAGKELLDQVIGKAIEKVEHTGDDGGAIVIKWLS